MKNFLGKKTSLLAKKANLLRLSAISIAESMKSGNFKSLYRGRGIEFEDLRAYLPGDAINSIDWNVTARMGSPFVKQYSEDRDLTVFFVVDRSLSMESGPESSARAKTAAETAALLTLAAMHNQSSVGGVFFDGKIRFSLAPKAGHDQAMLLLSKIDSDMPGENSFESPGSDLAGALKVAGRLLKHRSLIFVISDFRTSGWKIPLASLAQKHDLVAVKITCPSDLELPSNLSLPFSDSESGARMILPTFKQSFKMAWRQAERNRSENWAYECSRRGAYTLQISTEEEPALRLAKFFGTRGAK